MDKWSIGTVTQQRDIDEERQVSTESPINNFAEPGERWFGLIILLLGIVGCAGTFQMTFDTLSDPASLPRVVSVILILCGILLSYGNFRRPSQRIRFKEAVRQILPKDVCVMALLLAIYCIVLPKLHFIIASYLFMFIGMVYLRGKNKIVSSLIISGLATAVLVAIFQYIFMVILP